MTSNLLQADHAALFAPDSSDCWGAFDYTTHIVVIIISCVLGIGWAVLNFMQVRKVDVSSSEGGSRSSLVSNVTEEQRQLIIELGDKIANVLNI